MNFIKSCTDWNKEIFDFLSQKLKTKNSYKFWLRRRNTNERLDNGFWFNGTDKYIHIGISKVGSGNLSTQSIGFLIHDINTENITCGIEILFRGEKRQNHIDCYSKIADELGGFNKPRSDQFFKAYSGDIWTSLDDFFLVQYPRIMKIINECGLSNELEIEEEDFEKSLNKVLQKQKELESKDKPKFLIANITWNSKDWKEVSEDASGHAWVGGANIPHESWNFDLENDRNPADKVVGFAKFTHPPKVEGNNNLIVFYSQNKIVGFYGKAEILKEWVSVNEQDSYNLIGEKDLAVVLENKIENLKQKGFLEDKERVGQVGFSYLEKTNTVLKIIDEAIGLNPNQFNVLNKIKDWVVNNTQSNSNITDIAMKKLELNQILYGPPGTGKTYTTIDKVVEICEPNLYSKNHKSNKEIYDNLIEDGRVVFTTFHQSMSYEDFIEGIKPVKPEEDDIYLKYDVEPGILRNIASNAKKIKISKNSVNWDSPRYFKMSIGGKNRLDLHDWCIENSTIALGWGGNKDLSKFSKIKDWKTYRDEFNSVFPELVQESRYNIQSTYSFLQMDINDIVIISKGNNIIDAIGIVKGEYFFNDDNAIDYNHFRKVEWISTNMAASPEKFLKKKISQQSIYEFYSQDIKKDVLKELTSNSDEIAKPYVLVIDEINRGNVSAIFGELITLIEEDKRIGAENELSVTLPYSKIKFGIPSNLFIIGTMNTADRSVEALDTALRRRFTFEEMLPKPELLKDKGENNSGNVGAINLEELLITINERIEALVDRDHTIGHAFFMTVDSMTSLRKVFTNKVIPLLQEYFYGDYAKMEMVIGPNFFNQDKRKSKVMFAVQNDEVEITTGSYQLVTIADDTEFEEALKRLLASK